MIASFFSSLFIGKTLKMPETKTSRAKKCPFCAEIIQAAAVKCRFCSEFLFPEDHPALDKLPDEEYDEDDELEEESDVLFRVRPSIFAGIGLFIKTALFIALAGVLYKLPIENYVNNISYLSDNQYLDIQGYRVIAAIAIVIGALLIFVFKIIILKSTAYEVTPDRIEWERGIFNRRIDNLDMFRVIDLKLHRSITDCIIGIGTVTLYTKDQTDAEFEFYKVRNPRKIFNILKKTTLEADAKQGVIHLE